MTAALIEIATGYRPGVIGRCLELQARYYARHGFGCLFEAGRAREIADFFAADSFAADGAHSQFWSALVGHTIVGTIAIDAAGPALKTAQLRWFIVDDLLRSRGVGRRLLAEAVSLCDASGFSATHLWTFAGLDAARKLYEHAGFVLVAEEPSREWGPWVTKQHFIRPINATPA